MEVFLFLNGYEIIASIDEQEELFLNLASGKLTRGELSEWIKEKSVSKTKWICNWVWYIIQIQVQKKSKYKA